MKKIIFLLLGLWWLVACSGNRAIVMKEGEDVLVSQDFLAGIANADPNLPVYFSHGYYEESGAIKKDNSLVQELGDYSADYLVAENMADSAFWMFQTFDGGRNLWLAQITAEPTLKLLNHGFVLPKANGGIAGRPVVRFIIKAEKLSPHHDIYNHADLRYSRDFNYIISWDKDAFAGVDEIRQFNFATNPPSEHSVYVVVEASAMIDTRNGQYFQLYAQGQPAVKINQLKTGDLQLDGLALTKLGDDFYLNPVVTPKLPPLDKMLQNSRMQFEEPPADDGNKPKRVWNYKGFIRNADYNNYPNGYISLNCNLIRQEAEKGDNDYYYLFKALVESGSVGTANQVTVVVDGEWLNKNFPALFQKFEKDIQYP